MENTSHPSEYPVVFFDNAHDLSTSWVEADRIQPVTSQPIEKPQIRQAVMSAHLKPGPAVKRAEEARGLSRQERLAMFSMCFSHCTSSPAANATAIDSPDVKGIFTPRCAFLSR